MKNKNYYALTFFSDDKPGIVASVSKILFDNGINIEDSSSTLLRGFFSMILLISKSDSISEPQLKEMFVGMNDITMVVKEVDQLAKKKEEDTYVISVYGADQPGLVYKVSSSLSGNGINIIDLQTKVAGKEDRPVYVMVFEVTVPESAPEKWIDELSTISEKMGTDVNVRHIETYEF